MKIFGIKIETKKELRVRNTELEAKNSLLTKALECATDEIFNLKRVFPFELSQTVFDVALKNAQGKYAKKNPSFLLLNTALLLK